VDRKGRDWIGMVLRDGMGGDGGGEEWNGFKGSD